MCIVCEKEVIRCRIFQKDVKGVDLHSFTIEPPSPPCDVTNPEYMVNQVPTLQCDATYMHVTCNRCLYYYYLPFPPSC